ncbi:MAG: gas vesicle protein [Pseudomonadota bacterium]
MSSTIQSPIHSDSLADVLERVLDKGVVIAGDVVISLVGIELLSIKLRLLITTVDKAMEMGINWWEVDPALCAAARDAGAAGPVADQRAGAPSLAEPREAEGLAAAFAAAERERERLEEENREVRGRLAILEKRLSSIGA